MCTVGCFGSNSAMPRLPRVISTACMPRAPQQLPAGPLERLRVVVDADAERLLHFRFVRRAGGQAAIVEQAVARVDEHRHRPAPRAARDARRIASASAGVTRPEP